MVILRIQHAVPDFENWKRAFKSDPLDRKASGVKDYRLYRSVAEPNLVMIDLDFDTLEEAEGMLERLHALWAGPGESVMRSPQAWIVETVESESI